MHFTTNVPKEKVAELLDRMTSGNNGLPQVFEVDPNDIKESVYSGMYYFSTLNTFLVVECKTEGTIKIATYGFWLKNLADIEGLPDNCGIDIDLSSFELHTTSLDRSETTDHISNETTIFKKIELEYSKNIPVDESGYDSYDILISRESSVKTEG